MMFRRTPLLLLALSYTAVLAAVGAGHFLSADVIAFDRGNATTPQNIHVIDLRTRIVQQVTRINDPATLPTWSPDGRYIAYQQLNVDDQVIYSVNAVLLTRPQTIIEIQHTTQNSLHPAWSPDGRYIAFSTYDVTYSTNNIHVYDLETRTVTNIAPSRDVAQFLPAWSPTGESIAVNGTSPFNRTLSTIYAFDFSPEPTERVIFHAVSQTLAAGQPTWTQSGDILFTSSAAQRNQSLVRTPPEQNSLDFPFEMPVAFIEFPDVSPDGTRMVFSAAPVVGQSARSLYIANIDGTNVRRITYPDTPTTADNAPVWQPRSR